MNSKLLLVFILGATTGAVATWKIVDEKYKNEYEKRYQDDRESLLDSLSIRKQKNDNNQELADKAMQKPDIMEYVSTIEKHNYSSYSENKSEDDDKEETIAAENRPYVIPPNDFGEKEGYSTHSLTYYANDILVDENDDTIDNVDELIGSDSLKHFGEFEEDSVYVRNDNMKSDFEILYDYGTY